MSHGEVLESDILEVEVLIKHYLFNHKVNKVGPPFEKRPEFFK